MVFTRRSDAEKYFQNVSDVLEKMSSDFAHVFQMVGIDLNEEDLLDIYFQLAEGPNTFERILIKEGSLTVEDCKFNYLTNRLYRRLEELIDGEVDPESGTHHYKLTRCPKCGTSLALCTTDTNPPMYKKICQNCGWTSESSKDFPYIITPSSDPTNAVEL